MSVDIGLVCAEVPTELVPFRELAAGDVLVTDERFDGTREARLVTEDVLACGPGDELPYAAAEVAVLRIKRMQPAALAS